MGKHHSKTQHQEGNTNINIVEHLENNSEQHSEHEIKLWLILVLNVVQVLYIGYQALKRKWRRQGFNRAITVSRDNIDGIQIQKWKKGYAEK